MRFPSLLFPALLFFSCNALAQNSLKEYLDAAALFKESGEYQRAIEVLEAAKDFDKDPELLEYRARLEFLSGRSEQALDFLKGISRKSWRSFLYLGLVYEDLGRLTLAAESYLKSLRLCENSIAYFRLAKIYRGQGDYKNAADYFSGLIKFDPSVRLAYCYLGECLLRTGDYRYAYKMLSKAINFYPDREVVNAELREVKEKLGESFFKAREKEKEESRQKVKLTSYLQEEEGPLVSIGLLSGIREFSFFCPGDFLISDSESSYPAIANKFYTLLFQDGQMVLKGYRDKSEYGNFSGPLTITCAKSEDKKNPFYVLSLSSGKGDFWQKESDRAYRGDLMITVDSQGLTLINRLSVEEYLYGVLSAEMSSRAPPQALRAQAVAARTFVFKNLGRHKEDGFDFCPSVHCQVYQGISAETPSTIAAVKDTKGEIIVQGDRPIETLFHANCGGCLTADAFGRSNYLEEKADAFGLDIPICAYREEDWFLSFPETFCCQGNTSKFRWQRVYDREDFYLAFGQPLEEIKDFLVKKKGDCFHYKEIEVITSGGSKKLVGDLTIRNYFDHLRSSAFKVEKKISRPGRISMLLFWGAGFGHGAGMCQDGAVAMAEAGYDWRRIISHYFPNTQIKKLY